MKEVKSHLDYEKMSKEERRSYERMLDNQRGWQSSIDTAKIEGRAEGLQEGIEKVAVSMYKLKIPLVQIIEATGLTEKQILEIVK